MQMDIPASSLIDTVIEQRNEIEKMYRTIPRGTYIEPGSKYEAVCNDYRKAETIIRAISYATGIAEPVLYKAAQIALDWYARTAWEKCLPDDVAGRLLNTLLEQDK